MTIGMVWLHRRLLQNTVIPCLPREITMKLMESLGIDKKLGRDARAVNSVNHFGYGAAAAILYSLVERRVPASSLAKGPIFGALVWLVSYLGLLPALGVLNPATRHPTPRNALMFVVHLVWGLFVGALSRRSYPSREGVFGAILTPSPVPQRDRAREKV